MRRAAATDGTLQATPATRAPRISTRRLRAAVGALVLAVACGGGDGDPVEVTPSSDLVGTYRLERINNSILPAVVDRTPTRQIELLAETLTLNTDRTFTDVTDLRETEGTTVRTVTQRSTGTYVANGSAVIFSYAPNNAKATATYSDRTLSMAVLGVGYLYRRTP